MVQLDPATFTCPSHGQDLTSRVKEQLEDEGAPFAFRWRSFAARTGRQPFEVVVTCPGDGTSPDTAHLLAFEGKFSK